MKYLVGVDIGAYEFDKDNKTISLTGIDYISLEQILLITNVTTNTVIYQFNKPGYGATIDRNVLVLDYDTTGMSDEDKLQIFIDYKQSIPAAAANSLNQYTQIDLFHLMYEELQQMNKILKKIYQ